MDELKRLVNELEGAADKVQKLNEIGEKLLNEYEVKIDNMVIEPLLVEAYYNSNDFPDDSVHAAKKSNANTYTLAKQRQKNNYGELYVHYGRKDGIDIVLSNGDYYLSFLIKNALIHIIEPPQCGIFAKQCKISEMLCEKCDGMANCEKGMACKYYGKKVLKSVQPKNNEITFVKRKGLKNSYADKPLAALPINKIKEKDYTFTAGESSTEIVKAYIEKQISMKDYDEEKLKDLAKGLIAWRRFKKE